MRNGLFLCLLLLSLPALATVYKWVDKNGNVYYSDKPRKGAIEVKPNVNTLNEMSLAPINPNVSPLPQDKTILANVEIVTPQDQQTIRDNNGQFSVTATAQSVSKQLVWRLLVDGIPYGEPQSIGRFQVKDLDRGEHQLQVVVSPRGSEMQISSNVITVFLHRHSKQFSASPLNRPKTSTR